MGKFIDMTGWKMSEHGIENSFITVLHRDFEFDKIRQNRQIRWICKCERCGTIKSIAGMELRRKDGPTLSCGCLANDLHKNFGSITFKDLTNRRFGLLVANKKVGTNNYGYSIWECTCDCGMTAFVSSRELLSGDTLSCGCKKFSIHEKMIQNFLIENNIDFKREYSFNDLLSSSGNKLRFDFAIFKEGTLSFLLEYQGKQHFEPVSIFGGEEGFEKLKKHDLQKENYCKENNIKLYTISYNEDLLTKLEEIFKG